MHAGHMNAAFPIILIILIGLLIWVMRSSRRHHRGWIDGPRACINCGQVHPEYAKYCRHCGRKLP